MSIRSLWEREPTEFAARPAADLRVAVERNGTVGAAQFFAATTSFTAPIQPVWVRSNTMPSGSLYLAS